MLTRRSIFLPKNNAEVVWLSQPRLELTMSPTEKRKSIKRFQDETKVARGVNMALRPL